MVVVAGKLLQNICISSFQATKEIGYKSLRSNNSYQMNLSD